MSGLLTVRTLALIPFFLFLIPTHTVAQNGKAKPPDAKIRYAEQINSIEKAIVSENENLENLKLFLPEARQLKRASATEFNTYKLHLSTYGNLLLLPNIDSKDLEKALLDHRALVENISDKLKDLKKKNETTNNLRIQTEEHFRLNEKQIIELEAERVFQVRLQDNTIGARPVLAILTFDTPDSPYRAIVRPTIIDEFADGVVVEDAVAFAGPDAGGIAVVADVLDIAERLRIGVLTAVVRIPFESFPVVAVVGDIDTHPDQAQTARNRQVVPDEHSVSLLGIRVVRAMNDRPRARRRPAANRKVCGPAIQGHAAQFRLGPREAVF